MSKVTIQIKTSKITILAILITAISAAYWGFYAVNSYNAYNYGLDMGLTAYDFYYHINYLSPYNFLQYITFFEHLAPDQLIFLPIFYLFPSPTLLGVIQGLVLSLTGLLIFYIAKDLIKNETAAFLMCAAFLINPGVRGIFSFNVHPEYMILPLYLLLFYSYIKVNKKLFAVSLILLLGVYDTVPIIVIFLGIAFAVYGRLYREEENLGNERIKLAFITIAVSFAVLALYSFASISLSLSYQSSNSGIPMLLRMQNTIAGTLGSLLSYLNIHVAGSQLALPKARSTFEMAYYLISAIIITFYGFGILNPKSAALNFIMVAPWLMVGLILGAIYFFSTVYMYYSYAIAGSVCAAIISFRDTCMEKGNPSISYYSLDFCNSRICRILSLLRLKRIHIQHKRRFAVLLRQHNLHCKQNTGKCIHRGTLLRISTLF